MFEEDRTYNRNWIIGIIGGLVLLALLAGVWMFSVREQLPAELATHWNGRGEVDDYDSLLGHVLAMSFFSVFVAGAIGCAAIMTRIQSIMLARIGLGFAVVLGLMINGLSIALVVGQLGLDNTQSASVHGLTLALSLIGSALLGLVVFFAYRPREVIHEQSREIIAADLEANDPTSAVALSQAQLAQRNEKTQVKLKVTGARLLIAAVAISLMLIGWYADQFVVIFGSLAAGLCYWFFFAGVFEVDGQGTRIVASKCFKVMKLEYSDIKAVHVKDVRALEYGGFGYRSDISHKGFLTGNGPAVVIDMGYYQQQIISMPDVATASRICALINAYRLLDTAKAATTK
ncbi:DUF1648 domain-containing protein [Arthrobacter sp. MYb213]|uniref:DUF1648 domain-containing protein n=1 Tax=Arthrobacter sp. MYb213 TaxID=1848595 RepID=UPI000CFB3555|nr:DUF1648 domain-containing protein [Arthrobacter sp. MYb213]PRB72525.1 hypothetical protein CQ011_02400 [Arthrobacter sp. MYb213]